MLPKISIVTVSYNQAQFIEENIISVIDQNYPNIEHIIIDAGSNDGTIEILQKYKHLIWTSEPDEGQSDGLNKGFKKASGEIIGWINSDDKLTPGALFKVSQYFKKNRLEIAVVGDLELIDYKSDYIRTLKSHPYIYNKMLNEQRGVTQGSTFFKKEVFEKIGYLDQNLHYIMDFEFFLRLSYVKTVPYIDETLAALRIQPESKTTNSFIKFRVEHLKIARKYNASIFSKGILSDLFVILTDPLRRQPIFRNAVRKIKGKPPWNSEKYI